MTPTDGVLSLLATLIMIPGFRDESSKAVTKVLLHSNNKDKLYKQICTLKDTHVRNIKRIDYDSKEQTQGHTETDE